MRTFLNLIGVAACFTLSSYAADDAMASGEIQKAIHETRQTLASHLGAVSGQAGALPITYHGNGTTTGQVMPGGVHIYYIWYGAWATQDPGAFAILETLARNIGGSPYFGINATYFQYLNGQGMPVANAVGLGGEYQDSNYSQGKNLTDQSVGAIVGNAITGHHLPLDPKGVYFVLATADVNETSGLCTQYCGWHAFSNGGPPTVKYAFIGNPARCASSCSIVSSGPTPNGDLGVDAMASIIAHELSEATTDPQLTAWFDSSGEENADKCEWTFGTTFTTPNGSLANVTLGGKNYLIQQVWSYNKNTALQGCALSR